MAHLYKHKKTGHLYLRLFTWTNCNNSHENVEYIYIRLNIFRCRMIFYRNVSEFKDKFDPIF